MDIDLYSPLGDNTAPTEGEISVLVGLIVLSIFAVIGVVSLVARIVIN